MPSGILDLPQSSFSRKRRGTDWRDDDYRLVQIIENMTHESMRALRRKLVDWLVIENVIRGVRNISDFNFETGSIIADLVDLEDPVADVDSEIQFRWDEIVPKLETHIGRLLRLDVSPSIEKSVASLQSMRDATAYRLMVGTAFRRINLKLVLKRVLHYLAVYGTCGLITRPKNLSIDGSVEIPDNLVDALESCMSIIPPWELLGIPGDTHTHEEERAVSWIQLYSLQELVKGGMIPDGVTLDNLRAARINPGDTASGNFMEYGTGTIATTAGTAASIYQNVSQRGNRGAGESITKVPVEDLDIDECGEWFVTMKQVFVNAPGDRLARRLVYAGDILLGDENHLATRTDVPTPIAILRDSDTGAFYGNPLSLRIIPPVLRGERMLERMLTNTADFDRLGIVAFPEDLMDQEELNSTDYPKLVPYRRDPTMRGNLFHQAAPVTSSQVPGQVAQIVLGGLDRLTMQGPIYEGQAAKRTDSGVGHATLAQLGSTHLSGITEEIAEAFTINIRACMDYCRMVLKSNSGLFENVPLSKVEPGLIGVPLNMQTGAVDLTGIASELGDVWSVNVGISSKDPTENETKREIAYQLWREQRLSNEEFVIMNYRYNWGFPIGQISVYHSYVKAVMVNLALFNDGVTPGSVPDNPIFFDRPIISLLATEEFVSVPEMELATDEVRSAFETRIANLRALSGVLLPGSFSPIDQAAVMSAQQRQLMGDQQNV